MCCLAKPHAPVRGDVLRLFAAYCFSSCSVPKWVTHGCSPLGCPCPRVSLSLPASPWPGVPAQLSGARSRAPRQDDKAAAPVGQQDPLSCPSACPLTLEHGSVFLHQWSDSHRTWISPVSTSRRSGWQGDAPCVRPPHRRRLPSSRPRTQPLCHFWASQGFPQPLCTASEKILAGMVFVWMQTLCSKVLIPLGTQALASRLPPRCPDTHRSISPSQACSVYPGWLMVLRESHGADSLLGQAPANSVCEYVPEIYFWAAWRAPESQTAPASRTRLALFQSYPGLMCSEFPRQKSLSLVSVFLPLPWLPHLYQPRQSSREDQEVFQLSPLPRFALKGPLREGPWNLSFRAVAFLGCEGEGTRCWFQTDDVLPLTAPPTFF